MGTSTPGVFAQGIILRLPKPVKFDGHGSTTADLTVRSAVSPPGPGRLATGKRTP
jgi:hypothetical protein